MEGRLGSLSARSLEDRSFSHPSAFLFCFFLNSPPAVSWWLSLGLFGFQNGSFFRPGVGDAAVCPPKVINFLPLNARPKEIGLCSFALVRGLLLSTENSGTSLLFQYMTLRSTSDKRTSRS